MSKLIKLPQEDLEECRDKISALLKEYNCRLISADEYSEVLLLDRDTDKIIGKLNND